MYEEYPVPLQRRREPPPSLDPRRLADCCAGCCRAFPGPTAAQRNPLSRLSRWKIFDNLRRSLVPSALTLLLLLSWTLLPPAWLWTLAIVSASSCFPPSLSCLLDLLRKPPRSALASASARLGRVVPAATSHRPCSRSPACPTRPISAWMRSCAPSWRTMLSRAPAPGVDAFERARRADRARPGGILARDVDRPRVALATGLC